MKERIYSCVCVRACMCGGCAVSMSSFLALRCTQSFPAEETECAALNWDGFSLHLGLHQGQTTFDFMRKEQKPLSGSKKKHKITVFRRLCVAASRAYVLCFHQMSAIKRNRCSRGHDAATSAREQNAACSKACLLPKAAACLSSP